VSCKSQGGRIEDFTWRSWKDYWQAAKTPSRKLSWRDEDMGEELVKVVGT
jgi:hypothetical protein